MRYVESVRKLIDRRLVGYLTNRGFHISRYSRGEKEIAIVLRKILSESGNTVVSGPFENMVVDENDVSWGHGAIVPKLLGCLELELHEELEKAIARSPNQIVNVGCAEGYYAVGLARRLPDCDVLAIDIDPAALQSTANNARLNNCQDRVRIFPSVEPAKELFQPQALWVVDVEGAEIDIVDVALYPELKTSDLIIEIHDFGSTKNGDALRARIAKTHDIREIMSGGRNPNAYEALRNFSDNLKWPVMGEGREASMRWFVCSPKTA